MVCRSLFEAHRLLYSMQLAFKMQEVDKELNFKQMRLFLTGGGGGGAPSEEKPPNTAWLTGMNSRADMGNESFRYFLGKSARVG